MATINKTLTLCLTVLCCCIFVQAQKQANKVKMDVPITTFKTPDGETFAFKSLNKKQIQDLLKTGDFKPVPEQYTAFHLDGYTNDNFTTFLVVRGGDGGGYLFESLIDYERYRGGKLYWESSILLDIKERKIICSFILNCEYSYDLIKDATILNEFSPFEGKKAYLRKDGSVCFLRPRGVYNWYDGRWFEDIEHFKTWYKLCAY